MSLISNNFIEEGVRNLHCAYNKKYIYMQVILILKIIFKINFYLLKMLVPANLRQGVKQTLKKKPPCLLWPTQP